MVTIGWLPGLFLLAGLVALVYFGHARTRAPGLRRIVLINLARSPDQAVRGVLFSRHGGYYLLKQAAVVQHDGSTIALDGDVLIHRDEILFSQVLPTP